MDKVICEYKDKCSSYPDKCSNCEHNTGKRDYYKPDKREYYLPYTRYWWPCEVDIDTAPKRPNYVYW